MPRARPLLPKCPTYRASCGDTQVGIPMVPGGFGGCHPKPAYGDSADWQITVYGGWR
jgi:hypothetical protein